MILTVTVTNCGCWIWF